MKVLFFDFEIDPKDYHILEWSGIFGEYSPDTGVMENESKLKYPQHKIYKLLFYLITADACIGYNIKEKCEKVQANIDSMKIPFNFKEHKLIDLQDGSGTKSLNDYYHNLFKQYPTSTNTTEIIKDCFLYKGLRG